MARRASHRGRRPGGGGMSDGRQRDLFASRAPIHSERLERDPSLSQYFTPSWAADLLVADALRGLGEASVLEPSCGDGAMLGAIPASNPALGIEIDPRMAQSARERTGREVICGDLRNVDLTGRRFEVVVGNPPFEADVIDALVARALELIPDDGVVGLVLPAHIPASSMRMERWSSRFAIETRLLPRNLFPRLTLPLVWTRMVKTDRRTIVGMFLFEEQSDVSAMPDAARRRLRNGGTWREVVEDALAAIGGEASLGEIYAAVEPRRRSANPHWRDKTRQVLAQYGSSFTRLDATRWRLAA